MTTLILCFWNTDVIQSWAATIPGGSNVFVFVAGAIGINFVVEAIVCTIVGAGISKAVDEAQDEDARLCLGKALSWSLAVNETINRLPEELKVPFAGAKEGLAAAAAFALQSMVSRTYLYFATAVFSVCGAFLIGGVFPCAMSAFAVPAGLIMAHMVKKKSTKISVAVVLELLYTVLFALLFLSVYLHYTFLLLLYHHLSSLLHLSPVPLT
jgi:hypothetical protein